MSRIPTQPNHHHDDSDNMMAVLFVCFGGFLFLCYWISQHSFQLLALWRQFYLPQVKAIAWFSTTWFGDVINRFLGHTQQQAINLAHFMIDTPAPQMNWSFCKAVSHFCGQYILLIFLPLGGYLAFKTYQSTQGESDVYLRLNNAKQFYCYARQSYFDFSGQQKEPLLEQTLAALTPRQFCEANHLLIMDKQTQTAIGLDQRKAYHCFVKQLGTSFKDIETLLNTGYGWVAHKLIQLIPAKFRKQAIEYATQGHFYDFTVIVGLLHTARRFGVVPITLFHSLKLKHRALWYALASVGRKTAFCEGAGILAQYEYEKVAKESDIPKRLRKKAVQLAIDSLVEVISLEPSESIMKADTKDNLFADVN